MSEPCLRVGFRQALPGFDLEIAFEAPAGVSVLFGPSGAGKTRTLHAVAGLLVPDSGEIVFGDQVWFRRSGPGAPEVYVPSRRRRVGVVFQHYALFPHLSVLENVGFARWPSRGRREAARAWLARLRLEHLAERYPHQLSGGQQQRVALARALVSEPALLLLDEPFSAIDAAARDRIGEDLALVRRELGLTIVFVTHRIEDLRRLGDRLIALDEGRVVREGSLEASIASAYSLGAGPGIPNLFRARVREASAAGLRMDWDGLTLVAPPAPLDPGASVEVYVRPEAVKLLYPDRPLGADVRDNVLDALVLDVRQVPDGRVAVLRLGSGIDLHARFPADHYARVALSPGQSVRVALWRPGVTVL